jgi:vacuolar-type H+-ATPase subunit H
VKPGRVITSDEHEARERADKIVEDAHAEAKKLLADANKLANELVGEARAQAERATAQAQHLDAVADLEAAVDAANREGRVDEVTGLVIRATVPGVALGELVNIDRRERPPLPAEVVGFRGEQAVLVPLGELAGIAPASAVWRTGAPLSITCGDDLLGRVLDGIGRHT